jgi:hypothetical protein
MLNELRDSPVQPRFGRIDQAILIRHTALRKNFAPAPLAFPLHFAATLDRRAQTGRSFPATTNRETR